MDLILGTAGHIDHGKTSLIRALTGVDCDRLPEEKKRGITIDIGFAALALGDIHLGIVDVPGHERFIRNMLAGATGIDLALLVVAADESVRQQTREHLAILKLLRVTTGVIALTKSDLVTPDWLELVQQEVRELVADSFLAEAELVPVSATTGAGLPQLRAALERAARKANGSRLGGDAAESSVPFRLAIDRTFTIAGHGTVVTGSVSAGICQVGQELLVEPGRVPVRVRGLRHHDQAVNEVHRGQRAAINLVGVHHDELRRGQELTTPGHLVPQRLLSVEFTLLSSVAAPLKTRTRFKLHLGTAELRATLVLLDRTRLAPGQTALAQLYLEDEAVATWSQPFVARRESPVETIGGGRVLDPEPGRLRRPEAADLAELEALQLGDEERRAAAAIALRGTRPWQPLDLIRLAGISQPELQVERLRAGRQLIEIPLSPQRRLLVHRRAAERLCERVVAVLSRLHADHPLKLSVERTKVASRLEYLGEPAILDALLEMLRAAGRLRVSERGVTLAGHGPKLSHNEQKLLADLVARIQQAGVEPPSVSQCQQLATKFAQTVPQLLQLAADDGQLVAISSDFFLHATIERQVREQLTAALQAAGGLTVSQIREILKTSRKYAVPLCEHLDRIGFTVRNGDLRQLAAPRPAASR
ncbi:MAG: selenocysteine-specific translation elongation factor [Planctomycetota bacterium]